MDRARYNIPSINSLIAFEATARLGGMTNAAAALNTSQPSISRHIRNVEEALGRVLVRRKGMGVKLTKEGELYYESVRTSLDSLHGTGCAVSSRHPEVTIACNLEAAALLLPPVAVRLKRTLDDGVRLRVLNCDYDLLPMVVSSGVDIIVGGDTACEDQNAVRLLNEEIIPVASPGFVKRNEKILARNPRNWIGLPRLELARSDEKWADWATWFSAHDCRPLPGPVEQFENYLYMLEAAAEGNGVALGWNGFVNGYIRRGQLVAIGNHWLSTETGLYAILTLKGKMNSLAHQCLDSLASLIHDETPSGLK